MATIAAPARSSRRPETRRGRAARGAVLRVSCDGALNSIVCAALICSPRTTSRLRYGLCVGAICNRSRKVSELTTNTVGLHPRQLACNRTLHLTKLKAGRREYMRVPHDVAG